jgi:hypothetical protein
VRFSVQPRHDRYGAYTDLLWYRVSAISNSKPATLTTVINDEKMAKQILAAAKRVTKKRGASGEGDSVSSAKKKQKLISAADVSSPAALEESLSLPENPSSDIGELEKCTLYTNRAPLVLAFAVTLLKYTMPEQPLSSRLSLAQAVVSANSRTKAVSIGLESGRSAEEEGWGEGRPIVKIMGRDVRVLRRWGYDPTASDETATIMTEDATQESVTVVGDEDAEPPLWGLDLEALKKKEMLSADGASAELPIFTPQSARAYLGKSFDTPPLPQQIPPTDTPEETSPTVKQKKKPSFASKMAEKDHNLGVLLGSLDLLYQSWADSIDKKELDRRAWGWYIRVRPDVESGVAGWGGKGVVRISDILGLRRQS